MSQVIRALLIEDNRIEACQTRHWLAANKDASIEVEWFDQLSSGLERLSRGEIDVVLLDLNLPDSRGLETFATLHQRMPSVPIIVLTGEHDESMGIDAVQLGAEDYLVKQQVDGGKLPRTVRFAVARRKAQVEQIAKSRQGKSGRIVSFLGVKGGVGTTTLAINVAVALAKRGKSVVLAELKPTFGGLAFSLQSVPPSSLADLLEVSPDEIGEHELEAVLCPGPAATRILFGSRVRESSRELDVEHTEAIIKGLARLADIVILDLMSWPSMATSAAARLSQCVVLVVAREQLAVRCGQSAVAQLKSWGISGGLVGAIVVGQSDLPLSMDLSEIQSQLGCGILRVVPPAAVACSRASSDGIPLVLSQPDSDVAEACFEIAGLLRDDRGIRFEATL